MSIFDEYFAQILTFFRDRDQHPLIPELRKELLPILTPKRDLTVLKSSILQNMEKLKTEDKRKLILLLDFYQVIASIHPLDCRLSALEEHAQQYLDKNKGYWLEQAKLFKTKITQMRMSPENLTLLGITWRLAEFCESSLAPGRYGLRYYEADELRIGIEAILADIKFSTQVMNHFSIPSTLMNNLTPFTEKLSYEVKPTVLYSYFVGELNAALNAYIKMAELEYSVFGNWIEQANKLISLLASRTSKDVNDLKKQVDEFCDTELKWLGPSSRRLKAMLLAITAKIPLIEITEPNALQIPEPLHNKLVEYLKIPSKPASVCREEPTPPPVNVCEEEPTPPPKLDKINFISLVPDEVTLEQFNELLFKFSDIQIDFRDKPQETLTPLQAFYHSEIEPHFHSQDTKSALKK